MTVQAAVHGGGRCAVRLMPAASVDRLMAMAAEHGLTAAALPAEALPGAISSRPAAQEQQILLVGSQCAVASAQDAWSRRDIPAFHSLLNLPACCAGGGRGEMPASDPETVLLPPSVFAHALLAPLGISVLPVAPCRVDCPAALDAARQWLELADAHGYAAEAGWMRECLSWAVSWSELHGVAEVKTPLFKMCFLTGASSRKRLIRRLGVSAVEGSAAGLSFPYAAPAMEARLVEIGRFA